MHGILIRLQRPPKLSEIISVFGTNCHIAHLLSTKIKDTSSHENQLVFRSHQGILADCLSFSRHDMHSPQVISAFSEKEQMPSIAFRYEILAVLNRCAQLLYHLSDLRQIHNLLYAYTLNPLFVMTKEEQILKKYSYKLWIVHT